MLHTTAKRKGIVLIVVLGVLALLSVLAITFVSMTRLEKAIASNYVDRTRAILTAESGIDHAIACLLAMNGGALSAQDAAALQYNPDDPAKPLEQAEQPSFMARVDVRNDGSFDPVSGVTGSTHTANGDYFKLKVEDCSSKLNLNDSNGLYNIDTDPLYDDPANDPEMDIASGRLFKVIEYLAERVLGDITAFPDGGGIGSSVALAIINARAGDLPNGRFSSYSQLRKVLVKTSSTDIDHPLTLVQYLDFLNYVTLWSWQDQKVIRPTFKLDITVHPDQEADIPQNSWDDSWDIYFFFDAQTKGYELEPRCPVNVNTALVELLEALIAPIQGWYLYEGPPEIKTTEKFYSKYQKAACSYTFDDLTYSGHPNVQPMGRENIFGAMRLSDPIGNPRMLAESIRERVLGEDSNGDGFPASTEPDPFETWEEFEDFLHEPVVAQYIEPQQGYDSLLTPDEGAGFPGMDTAYSDWWCDYFHEIYIDLILANFNPNSRLNDFNPDRHIYQLADKAQLTQYTTELCFEPTGLFEVTSFGAVVDANNNQRAGNTISCVVELWKMHRQSTQAQFMRGLEIDPTTGGSNVSELLSENTHGLIATAGEAGNSNRGYTLQSYPEPIVHQFSTYIPSSETDYNYLDDSNFDGFLALAAYKMQESDCNIAPRFIVNFDNTLGPRLNHIRTANMAPDESGIDEEYLLLTDLPMAINYAGEFYLENNNFSNMRRYRLNTNQPTALKLTPAGGNHPIIGVLYPDGALSDAGRTLAYPMANIGRNYGMYGTLEFWLKPNYDPAITTRVRNFFSITPAQGDMLERYSPDGLWYFPHGCSKEEENSNWTNPCSHATLGTCTTRSITFGWWNWIWWWNPHPPYPSVLQYGRTGETSNHSWPGHEDATNHGVPSGLYNFEMHEWTHIITSWDKCGYLGLNNPSMMGALIINNQPIGNDRAWYHGNAQIFPAQVTHDFWRAIPANQPPHSNPFEGLPEPFASQIYNSMYPPNYIRFGEYVSKMENQGLDPDNPFASSGNNVYRSWTCDATFADIIGYADGPYDYNQFADNGEVDPTEFSDNYTYGRYLSAVDSDNTAGKYTSWPVNLGKEFPLVSTDIALIPRSVSWTLYKPKHNRNPDDANDRSSDTMEGVTAPDLDGDGESDLICVDIAINNGSSDQWYFSDKEQMAAYAGGSDFRHNNPGNKFFRYGREDMFRYDIYFNLDDGQTLYQSPVLDDITFTFTLSRPRILLWQVVR
ncbi:PilX N-terminal domain-containing pilus assembly protein [Planctomycetota bacterium]